MLAGAFFDTEIGYDEMLPEFKQIYELANTVYEPLITSMKDKVSYRFHPSVLPALFLLLSRCRDRMLRRNVIRLSARPFTVKVPGIALPLPEWEVGSCRLRERGLRRNIYLTTGEFE
jgi:hypothetical protein